MSRVLSETVREKGRGKGQPVRQALFLVPILLMKKRSQKLTLHPSRLTRGASATLLAAFVPTPAGSVDSPQQPEGGQECTP